MVEKQVFISNPTGLHARPATQLVGLTQKFSSNLKIINGSIIVDPKSIFSVLAGELRCGITARVVAEGNDEAEAVTEICNFIEALEE